MKTTSPVVTERCKNLASYMHLTGLRPCAATWKRLGIAVYPMFQEVTTYHWLTTQDRVAPAMVECTTLNEYE
jgi:hypothetical protein